MKCSQKKIFLIRHGETTWTLSGQHTGLTDIPLTENGRKQAEKLKTRLSQYSFQSVMTSPLQRSMLTCEIAGLLKKAIKDPDLVEWNYGDYEGLTSEQIWKKDLHWSIFSNGAPHGESIADIRARVDRVLSKIQLITGHCILFSHGHFLRALAARWLHLSVQEGRLFALSSASLSILGFEKNLPVVLLWNDVSHLSL